MLNEFIERYKQYPSTELLKIIKRPDGYQPDAINAASQVLHSRTVTEEEQRAVDLHFEEMDQKEKRKKERIESWKEKARDIFEPILNPSSTIQARKWLNIFLILVALQCLWTLYETIRYFIVVFGYVGYEFGIMEYGQLVNLLYVPTIFYLLYKRKRWGWILLFADNAISSIFVLNNLYEYFKHRHFHAANVLNIIWSLIICAAFLIFLWQDDIAAYFNIDTDNKKKFAIRIGIVSVFVAGLVYAVA